MQATKEQFTGHPIANLFRQDLTDEIELLVKKDFDSFVIKASVGAGNWANVPWLSILNPKITTTTQDGIYPVYLFKADGSGFYLSLNQGTTIPTKRFGKKRAERRAGDIKKILLSQFPRLKTWGEQEIDLKAKTTLGKSYEQPNISAKFYSSSNLPENHVLVSDLQELLQIYKGIEEFKFEHLLEVESFSQSKTIKEPLNAQGIPLSKPFLLLAGISGTGKTRFVREQAKTSGQFAETYCLTSVRPDWHEPSDLLGYISRLSKDNQAEYITTDVLQFIAKAWRAIASPESGLTIEEKSTEAQDKHLVVTGERNALDQVLPYWLCLDEMNLAPVEQYFADYLSVLETREWHWTGDSFTYSSDALLKPATIDEVADKDKLRKQLGFEATEYDELWQLICNHGLGIPFNLLVAGTVNMDETTHGFSRKVIDRALSFDFGAFFPNDFNEFFTPPNQNKRLSYPVWSHASKADVDFEVDSKDGEKINAGDETVSFLINVNSVLKNTPFELAFRALNELLLAVLSSQPQDELDLKAVWDDFMMCKVLPRIEGDTDKLTTANGKELLAELQDVMADKLKPIWQAGENEKANQRPDLYREKVVDGDNTDEENVLRIQCRTKEKLEWMSSRLTTATFTSFWP
ncbi:MrcB family domain-containing protein [Alkalimarinus sediminis]|uniref:DUF3578 domain-containing protein n=1 Tax=Alkalimarinus sediminis TaxID=1632866 RepID=A0A9E8HIK1_9ALTE|nr:DUF3578 domain-containing protein [Alkalimarinus sediminis]